MLMHPSRRNTVSALVHLLLAIPLTPIVAIVLVVRKAFLGPFRIVVVAPETAFSFFIGIMELLRGRSTETQKFDLVIVLDRWPHYTFGELYQTELSTRIVWSKGLYRLVYQALLLQPQQLVSVERLDWRNLRREFHLSNQPMSIPEALEKLGRTTLQQIGCAGRRLVALSVYTRDYDEERSPRGYVDTRKNLETVGTELNDAISFLKSENIDVVLLGSPDTGRSRIPRGIPRLAEFGTLGGPHEVAIASGCDYFWTDAVGAAWLCFPFRRPWLITNQYSLRTDRHLYVMDHLAIPVRFLSRDGRLMTIREELAAKPPFSKMDEYQWIRNSPEEIVEAHKEMLARLDGTWVESPAAQEVQRRYEDIFVEFPQYYPLKISTTFLIKHQYLLE